MSILLGHSSIVELLLERGADYASTDGNGALALHYAAQNDYAVGGRKIYMSHFAYACKMRYPLNLVLENSEYLWFY